jgi:hypothetical protein
VSFRYRLFSLPSLFATVSFRFFIYLFSLFVSLFAFRLSFRFSSLFSLFVSLFAFVSFRFRLSPLSSLSAFVSLRFRLSPLSSLSAFVAFAFISYFPNYLESKQDNINPIEKVENSSLIVASTIHHTAPADLIAPEHLERISSTSPLLISGGGGVKAISD